MLNYSVAELRYFSLSLIQRKGNKRKIKCYGSVVIRVKPLVNGTSTRLFKAQTASSLLTPGKTLTDATTPMHEPTPHHSTCREPHALSSRAKRRISVTHSWVFHFSSADDADNADSFCFKLCVSVSLRSKIIFLRSSVSSVSSACH